VSNGSHEGAGEKLDYNYKIKVYRTLFSLKDPSEERIECLQRRLDRFSLRTLHSYKSDLEKQALFFSDFNINSVFLIRSKRKSMINLKKS